MNEVISWAMAMVDKRKVPKGYKSQAPNVVGLPLRCTKGLGSMTIKDCRDAAATKAVLPRGPLE
jgi:hypothetical protein